MTAPDVLECTVPLADFGLVRETNIVGEIYAGRVEVTINVVRVRDRIAESQCAGVFTMGAR